MPPLKGIDRGIDGDMLKALEEIGHEAQIVVVDPSYDIPVGTQVVNYHGDSTSRALKGIIDLVPIEDGVVIAMASDDGKSTPTIDDVVKMFGMRHPAIERVWKLPRLGKADSEDEHERLGFYGIANDPEKHTLFVRTRDEQAYACAMFVVGHSQE